MSTQTSFFFFSLRTLGTAIEAESCGCVGTSPTYIEKVSSIVDASRSGNRDMFRRQCMKSLALSSLSSNKPCSTLFDAIEVLNLPVQVPPSGASSRTYQS